MRLLADSVQQVFGTVTPPSQLGDLGTQPGNIAIGLFLGRIVQIIYIVAGLVVVFMFIIGAVQWILSGGEKEKVEEARKRITSAIIGIILLALAAVILAILGGILGFQFFGPPCNPFFRSCSF